ncbi:MAG: DMT family transporter [SAR324 cluster bacterium]
MRASVARTGSAPWVAAAALVSVVLWASAFPGTRYALGAYAPLPLALLRLCVAGGMLAVWGLVARVPPPARGDLPVFLVFGLVGIALGSATLMTGLQGVSAGAGSFLVGTIPVFSALLARMWFQERLGPLGWLGIAISFGGVGLIAFGESSGLRLNWSAGWIVVSALCQSIYYVGQKPLLRRYSALQVSVYTIPCGALLLTPVAGMLAGQLRAAPWRATAAAAYLGAFPVGIAFVTWSYALARAKAARITSAMYAMPAIAITLAYFWLGEVPHPLSLLGGATALAGVAVLSIWGR